MNCPQRGRLPEQTPIGKKLLKTTADATSKNNLDNLPPP
ncbi:DUF3892 domain-containing protein [Microbacterium paraoxydans]